MENRNIAKKMEILMVMATLVYSATFFWLPARHTWNMYKEILIMRNLEKWHFIQKPRLRTNIVPVNHQHSSAENPYKTLDSGQKKRSRSPAPTEEDARSVHQHR